VKSDLVMPGLWIECIVPAWGMGLRMRWLLAGHQCYPLANAAGSGDRAGAKARYKLIFHSR
jgi:hypothetical protein